MLAHLLQRDLTGTVNLEDSRAVAEACVDLLCARYGEDAISGRLIHQAFADIRGAFWGEHPDYLPCDTPYHDLRHSLDTALLAARLVDGCEIAHLNGSAPALGPEEATLTVLLALMHDTGFLRERDAPARPGATLLADHEARSVVFARRYLQQTLLATCADQAVLIQATSFAHDAESAAAGLPGQYREIARILGTADLLAQFADRRYLEKCYYHLYAEFVIAGADRVTDAAGRTRLLYDSAEDLLRKTPAFFETVVRPRLDGEFARRYEFLRLHFAGDDPYIASLDKNLAHLADILARQDFARLRRRPRPLLPGAAAANS